MDKNIIFGVFILGMILSAGVLALYPIIFLVGGIIIMMIFAGSIIVYHLYELAEELGD